MKKFFTEWWKIQREERAMEKAYYKKHWKGVVLLNAVIIAGMASPLVGLAIKEQIKKKPVKNSKIEES